MFSLNSVLFVLLLCFVVEYKLLSECRYNQGNISVNIFYYNVDNTPILKIIERHYAQISLEKARKACKARKAPRKGLRKGLRKECSNSNRKVSKANRRSHHGGRRECKCPCKASKPRKNCKCH